MVWVVFPDMVCIEEDSAQAVIVQEAGYLAEQMFAPQRRARIQPRLPTRVV